MSLIYSAISSLESKPAADVVQAEPNTSRRLPQPNHGSPSRWIYAAGIGSVAAVVIGGAALAMVRDRSKEVPQTVAASAPALVSAMPQVDAQEPVQRAPLAESVPVQQDRAPTPQVAAPAPVSLAPKAVEQTAEPSPVEQHIAEKPVPRTVAPRAVVASRAAHRAHPAPTSAVIESPHTKPAIDDLNSLAMAAKQAIDAGNKEQAEAMLGQLAAHLPPESVTILRLRAWQALRNNDQSRAMALYGQIVEHLPDDESASINLAVLNWKTGQQDEARRIVGLLAERRPDSETVRRYVVQFGERR